MKQLVEYIKESLVTNSPFIASVVLNHEALNEDNDQNIKLNDFEVSWKVKDPQNRGGTFILELPEEYQDEEVNQYLIDMFGESMPSNNTLAKKYFGNNANNIIDARFEFEEKKEAKEGLHCTFEFDGSIDDKYKGETDHLKKYELTNLRYIIDWSEFDVINTSDDGLMYDLWDIFKRTKSSNIVKYMDDKIELDIQEKDMVFDNSKSELIKDK